MFFSRTEAKEIPFETIRGWRRPPTGGHGNRKRKYNVRPPKVPNDGTQENKQLRKEMFKRQTEVDKEASELHGKHAKNCPICNEEFFNVEDFMGHLSKCNDGASSSGEEGSDPGEDNVTHEDGTEVILLFFLF